MPNLLFFAGPPHHTNLMRPIADICAQQGITPHWFTANAEATFEHGLETALPRDAWHWLPAQANWSKTEKLYAEAVQYFRTLYAERSVMSLMIPPVSDRVIREVCCDWTAMPRLLDSLNPRAVVVLHELNRWGMIAGYWCHKRRIPFFSLQEGMYYGHPWIYTGHTHYSRSLVWGEATRRTLLEAGCPEEKVQVIGHPGLAARWEDASQRHQEAWDSLPESFREKKIVVLYITAVNLSAVNVDALIGSLKESPYRVVIQVAIMSSMPLLKKVQESFAAVPDLCHVSTRTDLLWPQMDIAEVVGVMGCSTVCLEALWRGKPVVELYAPGQQFSFHKAGVAADGSSCPVTQWVEAGLAFASQPAQQERIRAFVEDHIADANAAERIARELVR